MMMIALCLRLPVPPIQTAAHACVGCCITELDAASRLPSAADCYGRAVSLCGLSKSWGLPGLRLGWLACKDAQLLQQVREARGAELCSF